VETARCPVDILPTERREPPAKGRESSSVCPLISKTPAFRPAFLNIGRGERIRTSDHLNPIQVRYQAALRPESKPF
jgi:hypothetical protein